jgi:hypothetical protein
MKPTNRVTTMTRMTALGARRTAAVLALLLCLAGLSACQPKVQPSPLQPAGSVAVAGFSQPGTAELLAGSIPEGQGQVDQKVLASLDVALADQLAANTKRSVVGPSITRQCAEIVTHNLKDSKSPPFKYWLQVGECVPAPYILVPQLTAWNEREGGEWASASPASVSFDLYLIDVKGKTLVRRYHYEETQRSLSSNLFDAGKFFGRGGKWLSAEQLAREAMGRGIEELGL